MSNDKDDLYNEDLYGDLEGLDAGLDDAGELEDVPDLQTAPAEPPLPAQVSQAGPSQPMTVDGYGQGAGQSNTGGPAHGDQNQVEDGSDRIRPSDMPDEGKMFIGGLNWETTDDGLRDYMAQFGEIEAATIMRDPTGRSRGFAFLTYTSPASVQKVLGQTHTLDGKQIDPKRAIPRAEHERTAKVFVGGLAANVTSESLKTFLSQFGQVMDATVMFDRETGRSKGFAFATFADEESVGRAMQGSGMELEGKTVEIKHAQPRGSGNLVKNWHAPQQRFQGGGGMMGNGMGNMGNMGNMGGMGGMGGMSGGFDPNAMAMMYQNMMKGSGMGGGGMGMGGGFDPNAMAMMYQNMMKSMTGGMGNAPAINPNMAMRNGMGNMGNMGMGGMGMGNMMMGNMMGGMGGMGMGNMGMGGGMGVGGGAGGGGRGMGRPVPNAPRGPAAMRSGDGATGQGAANGGAQGGQQGPGAQRYSTQGNARARPY